MPIAVKVDLQGFVKLAGCLELHLSRCTQNLLYLLVPHKLITIALDEHVVSQRRVQRANFGISNARVPICIIVSLSQLVIVNQFLEKDAQLRIPIILGDELNLGAIWVRQVSVVIVGDFNNYCGTS